MSINPVDSSCPSTFVTDDLAVPPLLQESVPHPINYLSLKEELIAKGILGVDGRVTDKIPDKIPALDPGQIEWIGYVLDCPSSAVSPFGKQTFMQLRSLLLFLKDQISGEWNCQVVGGFLRRLIYASPRYVLELLKLLGVDNPELHLSKLSKYSIRPSPDIDIRIWLGESDSIAMKEWAEKVAHFLRQDSRTFFVKKFHYQSPDADTDYATATFKTGNGDLPKEVELLFIKNLKRRSLFTHHLVINIHEYFEREANGTLHNLNFDLTPKQIYQALLDVVLGALHVDEAEEVNFYGLPALLSFNVQGSKLEDPKVEPIFLEMFSKTALESGGVKNCFDELFKKTWINHHFSDPEAAIALAFNFCSTAKDSPGIEDEELLSILRGIPAWFKFTEAKLPENSSLGRILTLSNEQGITLSELFARIYTEKILGISSIDDIHFIEHRGSCQIEFKGIREFLHLLIPKEHCRISFQVLSDFEFCTQSPLCSHAELLGVNPQIFWEHGDQLLSANKKTPPQVCLGYRCMMMAQLLQPDEVKARVLLRYLPLVLASLSDHTARVRVMDSLENIFRGMYADLLIKSKQLLEGKFIGGKFLFEWSKILAGNREPELRFYSWELWSSISSQITKGKECKEQELFEAYLRVDLPRAFKLFLSFSRSLEQPKRVRCWKQVCGQYIKNPHTIFWQDISSALDCLEKLPMDSKAGDMELHKLHACLFGILMQQTGPQTIYPLMKQAVEFNLLHYTNPDIQPIWFELCQKLSDTSPEHAFEAYMIGHRRSLLKDTYHGDLNEFNLRLFASLKRAGSGKIAAFREFIGAKPEERLKESFLTIDKEDLISLCNRMEEKDSKEADTIYRKWLDLAERGIAAIDATHPLMSYYETRNPKILVKIVCHRTTRELFKSDLKPLLASLYSLIINLEAGIDGLKLFFDYFAFFSEAQKPEGLAAADRWMRKIWKGRSKLPDSIRQGFLKHASAVIESSPKRLKCFYYLKSICNHVQLCGRDWSLLVEEASNVSNMVILHKHIIKLKSSGCPLVILDSLIKKVVTEKGPETLNRFREYASWEGYPLQQNLSTLLLDYLKSLDDPKQSVLTLVEEKKLIEVVIPQELLHPWVQERIDHFCLIDLDSAIALGTEYGIKILSLMDAARKILNSDQKVLKIRARDLCSHTLEGNFLKEAPDTLAECWDVYFRLCEASGDQGLRRFVEQSYDEGSRFHQCLTGCNPLHKTELLFRLIKCVLDRAHDEDELQTSIPIIEKAIEKLTLSQDFIRILVTGYLKSSCPRIFLETLHYLDQLEDIDDPQIYSNIFERFSTLATRGEVHKSICRVYGRAISDERFSKEIPFAAIMLEGFSKSGSQELLALGHELLLKIDKKTHSSSKLPISIKIFLVSLLHCDFPYLNEKAEHMISSGSLDQLMGRKSIEELRYEMIHSKVARLMRTPLDQGALRTHLQSCLDNFKCVSNSSYLLPMVQDFMRLLACLNAASPDSLDLFQFLSSYVNFLNTLYPGPPIVVEESEEKTWIIQLDHNRMDMAVHPVECELIRSCYYHGIQTLVDTSTRMKFVSMKNRKTLVMLLIESLKPKFETIIVLIGEIEFQALAETVHTLALWIEGLSILEVHTHLNAIIQLFLETKIISLSQEDCFFSSRTSTFFKENLMFLPHIVTPLSGIDYRSYLSKDNHPDEHLTLETELFLRSHLKKLTQSLIEKRDSSCLAWALLIFLYCGRSILQRFPEDYSELMNKTLECFNDCVLSNPEWFEEITITEIALGTSTKDTYSLLKWLVGNLKKHKYLLRHSKVDTGDKVKISARYYSPVVFQFLPKLLELGDALYMDNSPDVLHRFYSETLDTLIDKDIWMCYTMKGNEYWSIVNRFISIALKIFDKPDLDLTLAIAFAQRLPLFYVKPKLEEPREFHFPFEMVKMDEATLKTKISGLHTIAACILSYFQNKPRAEDLFKKLIEDFKSFATSPYLFPESLNKEKQKFLKMVKSFHQLDP